MQKIEKLCGLGSPLGINLSASTTEDFLDWLNFMILNSNREMMVMVATIIDGGLWYARNVKVFQNIDTSNEHIIQMASSRVHE
jgi:hypothetical protein